MTEQRKAPVPSTAAKCPIGLDASPQICSAGTCDVCPATGATPSSHLEPDHIGREANARQHAVNAATGGRAIDSLRLP